MQLVPYTVDHAKNSILQIIEWHFLSRDVGEKDIANDTGWKEDSVSRNLFSPLSYALLLLHSVILLLINLRYF